MYFTIQFGVNSWVAEGMSSDLTNLPITLSFFSEM